MKRCDWCGTDQLYNQYHDNEWGRPSHDDRHLFEMLCLECAQAGLSWLTILKKRDNFKKAFDNFDAKIIALYEQEKIDELMQDCGIIRNQLKIKSIINNAKCYLEVKSEFGSFDAYIWRFVNHQPILNQTKTMQDIPVRTEISDKMSKDLKKRGFKFVGSTICYAYMQSVGMVNDHILDCDFYKVAEK